MLKVRKDNIPGIIQCQKNWVGELNKISIRPVKLSYTQADGFTPAQRVYAHHYLWLAPYNYRCILHNELVYDIDVPDWGLIKMIIEPLLDWLDKSEVPYHLAGSGGSKSLHVHVFFKPTAECVKYTFNAVRVALWNWVLEEAGFTEEVEAIRGFQTAYDQAPVTFSDTAEGGKVIRDYGGAGKKYKKSLIIDKLAENREDIYGDWVYFPGKVELWDASRIIERALEFVLKEPESCRECPVDMEWICAIEIGELYPERTEPYTFPKICRGCKKYKEM